MKIDLTISIGDLVVALSALCSVLGIGFAMLRRWDRLWNWIQHFPPHRHKNGEIEYPPELEDSGAAATLDKKVTV
ncbi:MAG TPA: hypothetical protein VKW06_10445 [Candidatus Angelobacter sp.]|nr:hypothetical protein [Candidatus Angelobacter sp.]